MAPGGRFIVTTRKGPYGYYNLSGCTASSLPQDGHDVGFGGTSAATPVVSGAAALLLASYGSVSPLVGDELSHVLEVTASLGGLNLPTPPERYGRGVVKPDSAIKYLASPRVLTRGLLAGSALSITETTGNVLVYFENISGLSPNGHYVTRYRLRGSVAFPFYTNTPDVWVRGSGSAGASDSNHYDRFTLVPWGRVLTVSSTSATFETFVYDVPGYGWIPTDPAHAQIAWSAVGTTNVVGVDDMPRARSFALRATPNPVAAASRIELDLPGRGLATVSVLDITGRVIVRLARGVLDEGPHEFRWNGLDSGGRACPAGVYFVRAEHSGFGLTRRLVLLRGASR